MHSRVVLAAVFAIAVAVPARASVMTFEGFPGPYWEPAYDGVVFLDMYIEVSEKAGGSGFFHHAPSQPSAALVTNFDETGGRGIMSVEKGFTGLSFYYVSADHDVARVEVFDGPWGTGTLIGSAVLPFNWEPDQWPLVTVAFSGIARSAVFSHTQEENNEFYVDNITIDKVPEPGTMSLLALGLGAVIGLRRSRF